MNHLQSVPQSAPDHSRYFCYAGNGMETGHSALRPVMMKERKKEDWEEAREDITPSMEDNSNLEFIHTCTHGDK